MTIAVPYKQIYLEIQTNQTSMWLTENGCCRNINISSPAQWILFVTMTVVCSSQTATENECQGHRRQSGRIEKPLTNVYVVSTKRTSGVYRHVISLNSLQVKTTPLEPTVFSTCNAHLARSKISQTININTGRDSSVVIVTGYGLDGPGMESRWEQDFPHLFRPAPEPTQPPVQWLLGLSRG
jgi:hypothetical protein